MKEYMNMMHEAFKLDSLKPICPRIANVPTEETDSYVYRLQGTQFHAVRIPLEILECVN